VLTRNGTTAEELLDLYQDLVLIIEAPALETMISRDPDDDDVLACALAAHAMVITSGDRDLLDLGSFQGIPILTATALIQQLAHQPHVPDEPTLP
jgi:predicted nucleic acid-binding protein